MERDWSMVAWHFNFKENSTTTKREGVVSRIVATSTVSLETFPWCLDKGVNKNETGYQVPRCEGKRKNSIRFSMIELEFRKNPFKLAAP